MKTTTIVREYDDSGRLVRETRTEVERPEPAVVPDQWWARPAPGWWQNPIISYVDITTGSSTTPIMVN